jgi:hypothetical protein
VRVPPRIKRYAGRYALVDGIPFHMPVDSHHTPALMTAFSIDADRARALIPGAEVHPFRLWDRGVLVVTVVNYQITDIGKYIEFSVAIACTFGAAPAPPILPLLFRGHYGTGQFVVDLPVSTEISVKGGKGIWGMPKHQANLDFTVGERTVSSRYDLDGELAVRIEIDRPRGLRLPIAMKAANYCQFRGMLFRSFIHFQGDVALGLGRTGRARLTIGDHPRVQQLKTLDIRPNPLFTAFLPEIRGVLDDYYESWFLTYERPVTERPEGFESVIDLDLNQEWLPPPAAPH